MVQLLHQDTLPGGGAAMIDLTDLYLGPEVDHLWLYSSARSAESVSLRDPEQSWVELGRSAGGESAALDAPVRMVALSLAGQEYLLTYGPYGATLGLYTQQPDGQLSRSTLTLQEGRSAVAMALTALVPVQITGQSYLVSAARQEGGIAVWALQGQILTAVPQSAEIRVFQANDIHALQQLQLDGQSYVLALSAGQNRLLSLRLSSAGTLSLVDHLDSAEGLFVANPTLLDIASVAGQDYVLVGAADSGSLSVVAILRGGMLQVTDQVNDDLTSRFAAVTALCSTQVEGQTYIAVAGADDGLSLLTLLPGGRLVHLDTIADSPVMALEDPMALTMTVRDQHLQIFVAGEMSPAQSTGGAGLTWLQADLGSIGQSVLLQSGGSYSGTAGRDQIVGGAESNVIRAGDGEDILVDGAGLDTLYGGAGADTFVLSRDGTRDVIGDFEPGTDRLDLSDWGRFYTVEALAFSSQSWGVEIGFGEERLQVHSADGRALSATDFQISDLRGLWHVEAEPLPDLALALNGTAQSDLLIGRDNADTLVGGGGTDVLQGSGGNDRIFGEALSENFDSISAQVYRLYHAALARDPDQAGLLHWVGRLTGGSASLTDVAGGFVQSAEFQTRYGAATEAGFVTLLYTHVLGRDPDAEGLAYWTDLLAAGTRGRAEVLIGFSESSEFVTSTEIAAISFNQAALQAGFSGTVFRLYQATLDRAPDLAGFLDWTGQLAAGQGLDGVAAGFVQSREFQTRYGVIAEADFVTLLYANMLGREPDAAGLAHWTDLLASGSYRRTQVVIGFSESPEFIQASAADLTGWMRGMGEDDLLQGGPGSDVLQGGILADCFVFEAGSGGSDQVLDLEPWDLLRFDGFGYADAAEALTHFRQDGTDVLFEDQGVTLAIVQTGLDEIWPEMIEV